MSSSVTRSGPLVPLVSLMRTLDGACRMVLREGTGLVQDAGGDRGISQQRDRRFERWELESHPVVLQGIAGILWLVTTDLLLSSDWSGLGFVLLGPSSWKWMELCGVGLCDSIALGHPWRFGRELLCACLGWETFQDRLGLLRWCIARRQNW